MTGIFESVESKEGAGVRGGAQLLTDVRTSNIGEPGGVLGLIGAADREAV